MKQIKGAFALKIHPHLNSKCKSLSCSFDCSLIVSVMIP